MGSKSTLSLHGLRNRSWDPSWFWKERIQKETNRGSQSTD